MQDSPIVIHAMTAATMRDIVKDAFSPSSVQIPGGNQAFQIVHYLLGITSNNIVDKITPYLSGNDLSHWKNLEVQFVEKLQLHIMAIGDNNIVADPQQPTSTTRMECLADYLFKAVVDA